MKLFASLVLPFLIATPHVSEGKSSGCGHWVGEFLIIYDMSGSYVSDLKTLRKLMDPLLSDLEKEYPGSRYGMATFIDKAYSPFGSSGNYCYRLEVGMTTNRSKLVNKVNDLNATGGSDRPESQLDGLYHGLRSNSVGWSSGTHDSNGNPIMRVVILATDADYHKAGEAVAKNSSKFRPHPGDREANCLKNDYPTEDMIVAAFEERQATPLFLISGSSYRTLYDNLRKKIGRGGGVEPLASDSSNVVEIIKKGVSEITCQTTTTTTTTTSTSTRTTTTTHTTTTTKTTTTTTTVTTTTTHTTTTTVTTTTTHTTTTTTTVTTTTTTTTPPGPSTAVVVGAASAGALGLAAVGMGGYAYANSASAAMEGIEFEIGGDAAADTEIPDREEMVGIDADAFA